MKVPTVEVKWVQDRPRILVQVILRVGDLEENVRCGTGSTLAAAFKDLALSIEIAAEMAEDNRMREVLDKT